jgi:catechol 2,3-dioxygenase-like lactoylglutathione lyase family enzyme
MSANDTGLRRMSLTCVPTAEQDRAVEFYESIGFEKRVDTPFGNGLRWIEVYLGDDSTGIALAPPPEGQAIEPTSTGITLTTEDIDATHAAFKQRGVDVDAEVTRWGGPVPPIFWFRDPSGHTLMVVQAP